jgi:hypothetical protein
MPRPTSSTNFVVLDIIREANLRAKMKPSRSGLSPGTSKVSIVENKKKATDQVKVAIAAVAEAATESDRKTVETIINQAKVGDYQSETLSITPGIAALLFCKYNTFNRDWKADWSQELKRRIETKLWKENNATFGFYRNGQLADGQNRLAAVALSGETIKAVIVYGLDRDAIVTIDDSKHRKASDFAKLQGVQSAERKEVIVKVTASYLAKIGEKDALLKSESEIAGAIRANDKLLDKAIELGIESRSNIANPTLKDAAAQTVAYLLLQGGWPENTVKEKLVVFQSGISTEGENTPFFVASQLIVASHAALNKQQKLSAIREIGLVVLAVIEHEKGTKATTKTKLRDAIKKDLPSVKYPLAD